MRKGIRLPDILDDAHDHQAMEIGFMDISRIPTYTVMVRWEEPTYATAGAAIAATTRLPRFSRAEQDTLSLKGIRIQGFTLADESVDLYLSDKRCLHIYVNDTRIEWDIKAGIRVPEDPPPSLPKLILKFPGIKPHLWDRRKLLEERLNRPVVLLTATAAWVFLTVEGQETLMFSRIHIQECNKDIMYYALE